MINLIINGACGTMGKVVASMAQKVPSQFNITAGVDPFYDGSASAFPIYKAFSECNEPCDAIIDFSHPSALNNLLAFAKER